MNIYNQLDDDHLFDDNHSNFIPASAINNVANYEPTEQGRTQAHMDRLQSGLFYTVLTGVTILLSVLIYCAYAYLSQLL